MHLDIVSLAVVGILYLTSAYSDLKTREVDDKLWWIFSLVGITLSVLSFIEEGLGRVVTLAISLSLTAPVSYFLYRLGFYGGADAKALIAMALILPNYEAKVGFHTLAPLMTLTNGFTISLGLPVYFASLNLVRVLRGKNIFRGFEGESFWKKALISFLGYRSSHPGPFSFNLEQFREGRKGFKVGLVKDEEEFARGSDIWVTPGIPLLVFLGLGYFAMVFLGDLLGYFFLMLYRLT